MLLKVTLSVLLYVCQNEWRRRRWRERKEEGGRKEGRILITKNLIKRRAVKIKYNWLSLPNTKFFEIIM